MSELSMQLKLVRKQKWFNLMMVVTLIRIYCQEPALIGREIGRAVEHGL